MSSTGMFMDVRIMMVVMMDALGTDGIAIAAIVTSNLNTGMYMLYTLLKYRWIPFGMSGREW